MELTGTVRFWNGIHPETTLKIVITLGPTGPTGPVQVVFTPQGGQPAAYNCSKKSDCFRKLNLEIDVCKSVNQPPILPQYSTGAHATRPTDLPIRALTIEEAYREAGVCVKIRKNHSIIDDTDPAFENWSGAELRDAMETYFSQIAGP